MRRVVAVVAVLVGGMLIGFTFSEHLFTRSRDAQRIADHYRPLMSTQGLAALSSGFGSVEAAGVQLKASALPQLQRQLGMTDPQFDAYVVRNMPGVAAFDAQAPGVVALVGPVIGQMQAERADYHRADQIPTGFLAMTSAPWLFVGLGGLLVLVGVWGFACPAARSAAVIAIVGLGLAIVPLMIGIPARSNPPSV